MSSAGRRRVAVTGVGLVTPVGNDVATTWAALLAGNSGGREISLFDASGFSTHIAAEVKDFRNVLVDDRKLLGQQQQEIRYVGKTRRGRLCRVRELALDVADDVVAEDAREPAAEARKPGQRRRVEPRAVRLDERQRVAVERLAHARVVLDVDVLRVESALQPRPDLVCARHVSPWASRARVPQ